MLKAFYKKLFVVTLAVVMLLSVMPFTVLAYDMAGGKISVTATGTVSNNSSAGTVTASAKTTNTGSSCQPKYTAGENTVTITNNSGADGIVCFDYTLTIGGGTAKVAGTAVTGDGTYHYAAVVASGSSVTVYIKSLATKDATIQVVLSNFSFVTDQARTLTINGASGGTVKYTSGSTVTLSEGQSATASVTFATGLKLTATPSSGYEFGAWIDGSGKVLSTALSYTVKPTADMSITPIFSNAGIFSVDDQLFTSLDSAIAYAPNSSSKTVCPVRSCTVPAGNYTIPNGVTLLIPFNTAKTSYTTTPVVLYGVHTTPSAYINLTLANGANITVANGGKICVPSQISASGSGSSSWNGTPTGPHGRITMNGGSHIELQSGSGLYVYGYISGSGTINALSGSTVYECFQIRSWRGGTATTSMTSKTVFPMNQYYIQNIEAPLILQAGASEKVYTSVNMQSAANPTSTTFIGTGGLFIPSSGSVTKRYDGATDRLIMEVNGNFSLSSMTLSISGESVNTGSFALPIASNITIDIKSGTTTVSSDVAFLPGSRVNVAKGAVATIASGADVYVYDGDDWGPYAGSNLNIIPVGYSTVNGTTAKRTVDDLIDAVFDVNGTLNVSGTLYTTAGGANIISGKGQGKIVYKAGAGTASSTQQVTQSGTDVTYVNIGITSAKLHNKDDSYTTTAGSKANDTYTFSIRQDKWIKGTENYDVNEDGYEDINDVSFIMSAAVQEVTMTSSQQAKGDFNGDGVIDAFDAAELEVYFFG